MKTIRVEVKSIALGILIGLSIALLMGAAQESAIKYQIASPAPDHFYVIDTQSGDIFYKRGPRQIFLYERRGNTYVEKDAGFIEESHQGTLTSPTHFDKITSLIESGNFSASEIQQLEAWRHPWRFDRTGTEIKPPENPTERFPVNGNFETDLNGWTKWVGVDTMNSQRTCQVISDTDKGSNVVEFKRTGGGADGSLVGIAQEVYIDLSQLSQLYFQLDIKSISHTLDGGGWAGGSEYPVCVELAFVDAEGRPYRWQHGFYHHGDDRYPISTKVTENQWFTYTSPNLKEITPLAATEEIRQDLADWFGVETPPYDTPLIPKAVTRVILFGGGWDFTGRADNLRFKTTLEE